MAVAMDEGRLGGRKLRRALALRVNSPVGRKSYTTTKSVWSTRRPAVTVAKWIAGEAESSIWTGLKTRGKDKLDVTTYRCRRCGYLESYA